ncbi:zinc finger protein basonuclin-2-like isoform X1 [Vespula squamosa]|uniref:Zinc finger protein basonuclin-2-like isoform X1 n=1 Tax=Vespula squamosa TaxID=30214 RepID=A0ABD1ZVH5_VESSQ
MKFNDVISIYWPTWFFRPDLPLASTLPTSHVANSSNVTSSNVLSSRSHQDIQKGSENPYSNNRIHGQTPTICTAQPETGDSLFWPGRYPIYSFVTIVLPRFLEKVRETKVMSLIKLVKFCSKREYLGKVTQSISDNFGSKIVLATYILYLRTSLKRATYY